MKTKMFMAVACLAMVSAGSSGFAAELDDQIYWSLNVDQLEYGVRDGKDTLGWDGIAWAGNDDHRIELASSGEKERGGELESAEIQLRYRKPVSDFFDLQAGLRQDFKPDPDRSFALIGLSGLAPQWIETEMQAFVSDRGETSARLEAEYDLLLTQRLVLQPAAEVNVAFAEVEERGIGSGVNDLELGLRLRYEVGREFAPYIGYEWSRKFGQTADFAREEGEDVISSAVLAGIKFWF